MAEASEAATDRPNPLQAFVATIGGWPRSRQFALAAVALLTLGLFAAIILQARKADYQLLYGNLAEADGAAMIEWLKAENIPYRLEANGRSLLVPVANVHETRLALASAGLPQGGGVGFEIFDKQSFALTDFVQKVNYSRALQGELARTIASLGPVETARVHLALPEKRLFKDHQQPATASVIIKLAAGKRLGEAQIDGIVHLVSNSIEGLGPDQVTVIDQNGTVLSRRGERGLPGELSPDLLAFQQMVEQRLEERAQALLDRSLGARNAMVRVSADLDFARTEKTEETFDPEEPVIRSEQVSEERSGAEMSGGIPGVQSNLEGNAVQAAAASPPTSRTQRTTNYEISKVVSRTTSPVGTVSRLSVSVLVADRVVPGTNNEPAATEPRTPEEIKALEAVVASALGIDRKRGDTIEVTSMPFIESEEAGDGETMTGGGLTPYLPYLRYGLLLVAGLLGYFLLVRPLTRTLQRDVTRHYKTVGQMEAEQAAAAGGGTAAQPRPADPLERIRRYVEADPAFGAHALKNWLQDRG